MTTRPSIRRRACCGALLLAPIAVRAQAAYPSRTVTMIVPAGAGGGLDAFARFIATNLASVLGQAVVVDDRPGANGAIGAQMVARAAPDGYTLMMGDVGIISINPALYPNLAYKPSADFAPVMVAARLPLMLVSGPNGFSTMDQFLRAAKTSKRTFGFTGVGNISHLAGEVFAKEAGIDLVRVPYKGAPPLLADVMANVLDIAVTSVVSCAELVKAGKMHALAATGDKRLAQIPGMPTLAELGFPGVNVSSWIALYAPAGTSASTVARLNEIVTRQLATAEGQAWMAEKGYDIVQSTPQQTGAYAAAEQVRWAKVVSDAHVQVD